MYPPYYIERIETSGGVIPEWVIFWMFRGRYKLRSYLEDMDVSTFWPPLGYQGPKKKQGLVESN